MKDYKRLTIRHEDGSHSFMYDYNTTTPPIKILLDRLAELEDKIEDGTLVEIGSPCTEEELERELIHIEIQNMKRSLSVPGKSKPRGKR